MEINKHLFEDVLSGKLNGDFVLYNRNKVGSEYLERRLTIWSNKDDKPYTFRDPCTGLHFDYYEDGRFSKSFNITPPYNDIVDFIPDTNMKENELTIEIPDGKIIDWDESKKRNKIILKDKQLTYEDVCKKLFSNGGYFINVSGGIGHTHNLKGLEYQFNNGASEHQLECILAKNKFANVANYLNDGWKPTEGDHIYVITHRGNFNNELTIGEIYFGLGDNLVLFRSQKAAQQAIEILGEETIKLALEPLGI